MSDISVVKVEDQIRLFASEKGTVHIKGKVIAKEPTKIWIDISGDTFYISDNRDLKLEYDDDAARWYWRISVEDLKCED